MTLKYVLNVVDGFFSRFFDDSIYVYDRGTIEKLITNASDGSMKLSDAAIMNELRAMESEGRLKIGVGDDDFITLDQGYWSKRVGRI